MTDRKKPGVAFWATVVLVVGFMGYPLSWGPAYWGIKQCGDPKWMVSIYHSVCGPLFWVKWNAPEPIRQILSRYDDLWL